MRLVEVFVAVQMKDPPVFRYPVHDDNRELLRVNLYITTKLRHCKYTSR
jgi:hypothetical protein